MVQGYKLIAIDFPKVRCKTHPGGRPLSLARLGLSQFKFEHGEPFSPPSRPMAK